MDVTEIAGYRVIRQLGAGGMGQVFLVQHPRLPRQDALKLLDAGVSRNDDFKARFQREADLLAQLSHPNIVTLHDRGKFEDRLWITMEYVDGTDAGELLKSHGPMPIDLVLTLIGGAGAALDYAWRKQRITHRDVKPANILVGLDGDEIEAVKLADFGIAKAAGESTSLTSTGITVGTMSYISPEAIEGRDVDNRSDIYSLGCTAFHLLTGRPPYAGLPMAALMSAHLTHEVPLITDFAPHLPQALNRVFAQVLAKDPRQRYQSCSEFVAAVSAARADQSVRADPAYAPTAVARAERTVIRDVEAEPPTGRSTRRVNRSWLVGSAVGVLIVVAVGLVMLWPGHGSSGPALDPTTAPEPGTVAPGPTSDEGQPRATTSPHATERSAAPAPTTSPVFPWDTPTTSPIFPWDAPTTSPIYPWDTP